jgi:hypothetical protein
MCQKLSEPQVGSLPLRSLRMPAPPTRVVRNYNSTSIRPCTLAHGSFFSSSYASHDMAIYISKALMHLQHVPANGMPEALQSFLCSQFDA